MDARPQVTHDAALVVRIATWLRGKAPSLQLPIMFGHNDLAAGMAGLARLQRRRPIPWFTSTEVVYGVTGTGVPELPESGVSP